MKLGFLDVLFVLQIDGLISWIGIQKIFFWGLDRRDRYTVYTFLWMPCLR